MLEKIINLVKDQVMTKVDGMQEIPEEKKQATVEATTGSLLEGLKKYATTENIAKLTSMLGLGKKEEASVPVQTSAPVQAAATPQPSSQVTPQSTPMSTPQVTPQATNMVSGLESNVVSALTSKVGLQPALAQKIAGAVIPAVMSIFNKKVNDDNDPGFNLDTLVAGLSKDKHEGSGKGLMDMVSGFFGKS